MTNEKLVEIRNGFETAFINGAYASNVAYKPQFISNDSDEGRKVLSFIEDELLQCDEFQISVAFVTMGGITPLLQTLKELERKGIKGKILTTNYLHFNKPEALEKLNSLTNITLRMYDSDGEEDNREDGLHTKGYIFKKDEIYTIIIGSANLTRTALTTNHEWNTRVVSSENGEMTQNILDEFDKLWNSEHTFSYDEFAEIYREKYRIIKKQRDIARKEELISIEKYRLQPNSMQVAFIVNLKKIIAAGENRALLISATGERDIFMTGGRNLGFMRVSVA